MELPDVGNNCSVDGCGALDFLPMVCSYCKRTFCSRHGGVSGHDCPSFYQNGLSNVKSQSREENIPISTYTHPARTGPKDVKPETRKALTSQQLAALATLKQNDIAAERPVLRPPKEPRVSPKIELMRLKSKAKGNSSIAMDDRLYLCINWKAKSVTTFINKTSVIGNAASQFARQLGISMLPDVVCRLRVSGTDNDLPSSKRFSEILATDPEPGKTLYNGCTLDLIC